MRAARTIAFAAAVLAFAAACSSTYKAKPELTYYHGQTVPDMYISVVAAADAEITFRVQVKFPAKKMYHLILDGNTPVAQGWFSTERAGGESYTVRMKPDEGKAFEPGKTYRFCVGDQNPEAVQMTSSNYLCRIDYTFVFPAK
jgi:hypothetical protein